MKAAKGLVLVSLLLHGAQLQAQTRTPLAYVRHAPLRTTVDWLSPRDVRVQRAMPIQDVFKGDSACFEVEDGNPLLYSYSLDRKVEKATNDAAIAQLASALTAIGFGQVSGPLGMARTVLGSELLALRELQVSASDKTNKVDNPPADRHADLLEVQRNLEATEQRMNDLRFVSDRYQNMSDFLLKVDSVIAEAYAFRLAGEQAYKELKDGNLANENTEGLRAGFDKVLRGIQATAKSYRKTIQEFSGRYCQVVGDSVLTMTLSVKAKQKFPDGDEGERTAEGALASMRIEPKASHLMEASAGGLLTYVRTTRAFKVEDGVVKQGEGSAAFEPAAGAFTNLRFDRRMPFWLTIGAVKGKTDTPDVYAGFTLKPAYLSLPKVNFGAGFLIAQVPDALKGGAAVGQPLPSGKSLGELTAYKTTLGFGLMVTYTGISGITDRK